MKTIRELLEERLREFELEEMAHQILIDLLPYLLKIQHKESSK